MTGDIIGEILEKNPVRLSVTAKLMFAFLAASGLVALAVGLVTGNPGWSLEALLVASLVVGGVGQAGIVWSAVFEITHARWGKSYRRLMELTLVGVPVSLLGFLILFIASPWWVPFAHLHLEGGKAIWLSVPFWAVRNFLAVLGMFCLSVYYLYHCLRPDLGLAKERGHVFEGRFADWLIRNWRGVEIEQAGSARKRTWMAPLLCLAYVFVYSMVGFDLVMALDVNWYSTLFGAYHLTGNLYMALALGLVLAWAMGSRTGPGRFFSSKHFGIMGTLLFAFCFLMGDFFWSQFLTIYYANLPEETEYILLRTLDPGLPWYLLAWSVLVGFFALPFLTLMFRAVKWVPGRVGSVTLIVLLAMILERFLTTAPPVLQLNRGAALEEMLVPLGVAVMATLGLASLSALLYGWIMKQVPMLPVSDPYLTDSLKDTQERR